MPIAFRVAPSVAILWLLLAVASSWCAVLGEGLSTSAKQQSPRTRPSTASQSQGGALALSRRNAFLSIRSSGAALLLAAAAAPKVSNAVMVMNDDGEYVQVTEQDWQTTWKGRLDKAKAMNSLDDVFTAARGAGNVDPNNNKNDSDAAKKRRAMSACRDTGLVKKTGLLDTKACTAKVLNGEVDFILDSM